MVAPAESPDDAHYHRVHSRSLFSITPRMSLRLANVLPLSAAK